MYVSGGNVTNTTLSSLMLAYAIEVAAGNVASTGVFSPTILTMIQPSECSVASTHSIYVTHTKVQNLARILLLRSSQVNLSPVVFITTVLCLLYTLQLLN